MIYNYNSITLIYKYLNPSETTGRRWPETKRASAFGLIVAGFRPAEGTRFLRALRPASAESFVFSYSRSFPAFFLFLRLCHKYSVTVTLE